MPQPSKSESASEPLVEASRTSLDQLYTWSDLYQRASELFVDLESCSKFLDCLAKTSRLRELLSQWKELGRPQIEWRELDSFLRSSATSLAEVNHRP
jgi:hypothetical protein